MGVSWGDLFEFVKLTQNDSKIKKNTRKYNYFTPVYQKSWQHDPQFFRCRAQQTEIGNYGLFLVLLLPPSKNPKTQNFEKIKKKRCCIYHFTYAYQKSQSYEVQLLRYRVRDRIFCHFGPIFALLPHYWHRKLKFRKNKKKKHWRYYHLCTCVPQKLRVVQLMRYGPQQIYFFLILSFYPLTTQKSKFLKNEIKAGDIIILHTCTKTHVHMLYCSWDMACDGCNCYFSLWAIFCPFTHGDIIILHMCTKNYDLMNVIMVHDRWPDRWTDRKSDI